jgi:hypothetical protein
VSPIRTSWAAEPEFSRWAIGVVSDYRLFSLRPGDVWQKSATVDLRSKWNPDIFRKNQQKQKQPGVFPSLRLLDASADGGRFVVNLWGEEYRDPGPLVIVDAATGTSTATVDVSDENATAAYLPGALRLLVHWIDHISAQGGPRTAIFDATNGARLADTVPYQPAGPQLCFLNGRSKLIYGRSSAERYGLLDTASWKDLGALPVPSDLTVLDARESTLLLEGIQGDRNILAWDYTRPAADLAKIDHEPFTSGLSSVYVLAGSGDRIVKLTPFSDGTVAVLNRSDGKQLARVVLGKVVLAYAPHPSGTFLALLVDSDLVVLDVADGRVISRSARVLPQSAKEPFLFWYRPR